MRSFNCLFLLIVIKLASCQKDAISRPQVSPFTLTIGFVLPNQSLTDPKTREQLRKFLAVNSGQNDSVVASSPSMPYRLRVNPVYVNRVSLNSLVKDLFCSRPAEGVNALFMLIDKANQGNDGIQIARFLSAITNRIGLPTLTWSSLSNELEEMNNFAYKSLQLTLAPATRNQAYAVDAFLKAYQWRRFSIMASSLTEGHHEFIHQLRALSGSQDRSYSRFTFDSHQSHQTSRIIRVVKFSNNTRENIRNELLDLRDNTDTRILILYANQGDASTVFDEARMLGMTSGEYLWICLKPALGDLGEKTDPRNLNFIPGTIAVTYDTSLSVQHEALKAATKLWSKGMEKFASLPNMTTDRLAPKVACDGSLMETWSESEAFFEILKSTPVTMFDKTSEGFDDEGLTNLGEITLLNLDGDRHWKKIGLWTKEDGLVMDDIIWPGGYGKPPTGRGDSTILKVATLEEPPYVVYEPPDPISGICPRTAVPCRLSPVVSSPRMDKHSANQNVSAKLVLSGEIAPSNQSILGTFGTPGKSPYGTSTNGSWVCCVGFCMDLLRRLSTDIGFRFEVFEVRDRKWGAFDKTKESWNGLVEVLLELEADMVVTSLKISKERSTVIDFSIPFLETGITILVRVREGVISPVAFLEPFSIGAWIVVLIGCVNSCALSTFLFEYFSPRGLDQGESSTIPHKFSLFRSLWLVWAMLFKAAVKVDIPRGIGARLMANTWGMFCVIFMSSYMANLAAFMITKEDFHDFAGIDDPRLHNPYSKNPPWKFATIPSGATETILKTNYPEMFDYMRQYNRSTADVGMWAVKNGELDAFIYDATVMEYKAGRDKECRLRTVGKWYAMTGYGIAFPKGSRWLAVINKYIIEYQHTGYLQQLQEFWLTGACKERQKQESNQSQELGILNFTSAFIMLVVGLVSCSIFLLLEHIYVKWGRRYLRKIDKCGWCGLISLSMGASLSFKDTVKGALWQLQSDAAPCTNNSCQFKQEFLKAQLRRARNQLKTLEQQSVSPVPPARRETTFGADRSDASPMVASYVPLQIESPVPQHSATPSPTKPRSKRGSHTHNGHANGIRRKDYDHEPLLNEDEQPSRHGKRKPSNSDRHSRLYRQCQPTLQHYLIPATNNDDDIRELISATVAQQLKSEKTGNDKLWSWSSHLPQPTSPTSHLPSLPGALESPDLGAEGGSSSDYSNTGYRRVPLATARRDVSQQPLNIPRSVSFGTTTTYIAPSPVSSAGEETTRHPKLAQNGEVETNL